MNYSLYQEAIFSFVKDGSQNAVVEAVAGSGKTTTIVKALDFIGSNEKAIFLAFNAHIAKELTNRVPLNTEAKTLNSTGWAVCRKNTKLYKVEPQKDDWIIRDLLNDQKLFYKVRNPIKRMVSLFKALNIVEYNEARTRFNAIVNDYNVNLPEVPDFDFESITLQVWHTSINDIRIMNFDDQIFQPIYQGWEIPSYDRVFGDEFQDWSPIQIEFVRRIGESGQVVTVGDRYQSIYGFRGADPNAIHNLIEAISGKILPLSICYRCPNKVIEWAKQYVPHIEAPENNSNGDGIVESVSTPDFLNGVADGDFVLCRVTAPLVKRCLQMITQGRKASVKGRAIGDDLVDFLKTVAPFNINTPEFLIKLEEYKKKRLNDLLAVGRENQAIDLEDKCDTLDALATNCKDTLEIKQTIEVLFSDNNSPGITFCTGHRSKGLETRNVWILRPDLCPHPKASGKHQEQQEMNLLYVMGTRAQYALRFVMKERDER